MWMLTMREKRKDINKACDDFLESRGWPKFSFKRAHSAQIARAVLRKRRRADYLERIAQEIEEGGE